MSRSLASILIFSYIFWVYIIHLIKHIQELGKTFQRLASYNWLADVGNLSSAKTLGLKYIRAHFPTTVHYHNK